MSHIEEIEQFYQRTLGHIPNRLADTGHFNVFRLEPYIGENAKPVPYVRRNYYKVMMVEGEGIVHYADRIVKVNGVALSFSNPQIPYKWNRTDLITRGCFCIFNDAFFQNFGSLQNYEVFHPIGQHIFHLDQQHKEKVEEIFYQLFSTIESDYQHKYDLLRIKIFDLVHLAQQMDKTQIPKLSVSTAAERIANLFMELLERQFPIDEDHREIKLRSPSDYADQLNIHVNHLNKSIKTITQKTTSQVISERMLLEAKKLLKQSDWNVSDIAYALGFGEPGHFSYFVKKNLGKSPKAYRSEG